MYLNRKQILTGASAIILICAISFAWYQYNRKPGNLLHRLPQVSVNAVVLAKDYLNDEKKANDKYLGKIVDVKGSIVAMTNQQDTLTGIELNTDDALHNISCSFNRYHIPALKKVKIGDTVVIRGICTGYLVDVELNRCVLVK